MSFENRYCHWKGKYTRIFSSLMETFLFVILLIFLQWAIQMVYKQVFSKQRSNFHWFYLIFSDVFSCSFEFSFFSLIGIIIINYKLPLFRRSVLINFALPNINPTCYTYICRYIPRQNSCLGLIFQPLLQLSAVSCENVVYLSSDFLMRFYMCFSKK